MTYEVKAGAFEGPIDLLLNLITRRRVDIYEVSLSAITDEYMAVLDDMPELDLETATGFLVVAAALLELKAARLLPTQAAEGAVDPTLLEQRDLLLARVVETATYREAGAFIAAALQRGEGWHPRVVGLEERYARLAPDPLATTSVADLALAAAAALIPRPRHELDTSYVAPARASLPEVIAELARSLAGRDGATLEELCGRAAGRDEVVVRFLALLELYKSGAVELTQQGRFGDIRAAWTGSVAVGHVHLDDLPG